MNYGQCEGGEMKQTKHRHRLAGETAEGVGAGGAGKCKTKVNLNNKKPMGRNLNNEHAVGGGGER